MRQAERSQAEHLKSLEDAALPWQSQTCSYLPKVCFCVLGCVWEDALRAEEPGTLSLAMAVQRSSEPWAALAACLGWRWQRGWHRFGKRTLSSLLFTLLGRTTHSLSESVEMFLSLYFWNHVHHRRESWPMRPLFDGLHPEQRATQIINVLEDGCRWPCCVQLLDSLLWRYLWKSEINVHVLNTVLHAENILFRWRLNISNQKVCFRAGEGTTTHTSTII